MPIEFFCSQCESKLRTADDTAGKGARCPNCGNIETVPAVSQQWEDFKRHDADALASHDDASSFAKSDSLPEYQPASGSTNPFAAPSAAGQPTADVGFRGTAESAQGKLMAPAIVLIVISSLSLMGAMFGVLAIVIEAAGNRLNGDSFAGLIALLVGVLVQGLVLLGSISMLRLKGYGLAMAGAICAMLSGLACCMLPTGFGIWALVVLLDPDVKRFFG